MQFTEEARAKYLQLRSTQCFDYHELRDDPFFRKCRVYDIETYPNCFLFTIINFVGTCVARFEISDRKNDLDELLSFIDRSAEVDMRWFGYNNIHFDYPVMHFIAKDRNFLREFDSSTCANMIYQQAMSIIKSFNKFAHVVWDNDQLIKQIDIYKVHHFDNPSKATSLKVLQFNMRSPSVEDLPFPVGTYLSDEQMDQLAEYNMHDCVETLDFILHSRAQIDLRFSLSESFEENFMNSSDVKIGERILVNALEKAGVEVYVYSNGKKEKRQTKRDSIALADVILPYVQFDEPEFQRIHDYFASKIITETNGVFVDLNCSVRGMEYAFGTGGLHASVEKRIVREGHDRVLCDIDVKSYYPNLGIKNRLYPAHLGEEFCDAYEGVYHTRSTFKKGSPENESYKLALNGAYGGSNNEYSPFLDPMYTMSITINGQLLLCMLIEQLIKTPGLEIIQANTDGITYLCPVEYLDYVEEVKQWWQELTQLELEEVRYSMMAIRDVNSYLAVKTDGKIKRIGAYAYETALENPGTRELPWHKDWSMRVVAKAAEAALVRGVAPDQFLSRHNDGYDFMLRARANRGAILRLDGEQIQNTVRYSISHDGGVLEKVMEPNGPPGAYKRANGVPDHVFRQVTEEVGTAWDPRIHTKNKSVYEDRITGLHTGFKVALCNRIEDFDFWSLNMDFYRAEINKLVEPLR